MGSSTDPTLLGWLFQFGALFSIAFMFRQMYRYANRGKPTGFKQPKWARDDGAEIKQGPLFGEDAAGYVEAKFKSRP